MYDTYADLINNTVYSSNAIIWSVVIIALSILGGLIVYLTFLKDKKQPSNKFLCWLKDFLNFKNMCIETLLKVSYVILAIYITLTSFNYLSINFVAFLLYLIIGNVILRLIFEAILVIIMIWKNTAEINKKIK